VKYEDIKGLNVKKGLSVVANNKKLYIKLLGSFVSNAFCEQLLDAIKSGDSGQILRKAHSLKGVAGNMHMNGLYETSRIIETGVKGGVTYRMSDEIVSRLLNEYRQTLESVNMLIQNPEILDKLE